MTESRKRVVWLAAVLLAGASLSCVFYCGWRTIIKRKDVVGVYVLDTPALEVPRTYGIHRLTLMENGRYEYRWRGAPAEDEAVHTGGWTFSRFPDGAHVTLDKFRLEPRNDAELDGRSYRQVFPVVRSSTGVLQLGVHDYEAWNFNKQPAGVK